MPPSVEQDKQPANGGAHLSARSIPPDVYPESGHRLPLLKPEDLDADGRAAYDAMMDSVNAGYRGKSGPGGGMRGPAGIQLHSPGYRRNFQAVNDYLRFHSGIPPRLREIVILCTAREIHSQFEWAGHDIKGRAEGVEPEVIETIRVRGLVDGLADADATAIMLVREAITELKVSPETYARARKHFGERVLVDISGLIGHYITVGIFLRVFDMQMWPERKELLPPRPRP